MDKILLVLKLLPAIIGAIKALEEGLSGAGLGAQKLDALRQILELTDSSVKNLWPTIEGVVKVVVNLFNVTGAFVKQTP